MREKDQTRFLSWFKPTNIFKLSQVEKDIWTGYGKSATYAMEAFGMAVLIDAKLGRVSYTSGNCINDAICGFCPFTGYGNDGKKPTYVSFKKHDDGSCVPLVVHNNWCHFLESYGGDPVGKAYGHNPGGKDDQFLSENVEIDGPMKQHFRCKDGFVRAILKDGTNIRRLIEDA
jgi:hypothetical protein